MKNEIITCFNLLRDADSLIIELFKYSFVNEHYLKNLTNYTNTKNISVLKKIDILTCLKCEKDWLQCKPNNSHNMSQEIMLKDFIYERNKIIIFNSTRPFTLKHLNIKKVVDLSKNINALLEDINSITTFGGICRDCDKIYNDEFEYNKNLNFNNTLHVKLLIERASYFKYYRENLATEIINILLNLKQNRNVSAIEWKNYRDLCKKIKEKKYIENRKFFFSKDNIILNASAISFYMKKTLSPNKGIMLTDILYDNGKILLANVFKFRNQEIFILSSKEYISMNLFNDIYNKHIKNIDIKKGAANIDFKDIVIHPNHLFEKASLDMNDYLYFKIDDIYLHLVFKKETYFIKIDEISKIFGINKSLFTMENILKIKKNKKIKSKKLKKNNIKKTHNGIIKFYINQLIYIELEIKIILISCSWYKYETEGKILKEREFRSIKDLSKIKGISCIYNVLV